MLPRPIYGRGPAVLHLQEDSFIALHQLGPNFLTRLFVLSVRPTLERDGGEHAHGASVGIWIRGHLIRSRGGAPVGPIQKIAIVHTFYNSGFEILLRFIHPHVTCEEGDEKNRPVILGKWKE